MLFDEREYYVGRYEILFEGNLFSQGDVWRMYKVYDSEFPSDEELKNIRAIVCPGSYRSVYEPDLPTIESYKRFIRKVYSEFPHIKMAGVCFGH
jgi:GMP synthase-like glutamine amidotransferase